MGCGQSAPADNTGKQRNDEIENQLKKDRALMRNEIKMLLLGMSDNEVRKERTKTHAEQVRVNQANLLY